jgi:hypothetical protein
VCAIALINAVNRGNVIVQQAAATTSPASSHNQELWAGYERLNAGAWEK